MARAVISNLMRRAANEPLYDIEPRTGASLEVLYADRVIAHSFDAPGPGWFWWTCQRSCLPDDLLTGPFEVAISYTATSRRTLRIFTGRRSQNGCRTNAPDHVPSM